MQNNEQAVPFSLPHETDVVVVGAGPTGLTLACELALAGVDVVVLERLAERSDQSKGLNLQPRTAEVFDLRGLLEPMRPYVIDTWGRGHFGGRPLRYDGWSTRHPYQVNVPQAGVERTLEDRLAELGVRVARGHELTGITQHDAHVTAVVAGGRRIRASYLVGCDGGRSTVRKLVGVAFPGTDASRFAFVADVVLAKTPAAMPTRLRSVRDAMIKPKDGTRGSAGLIPLGAPGHFRVAFDDPDTRPENRDAPVPAAEVLTAMRRLYGNDVEIAEVRWASRFTNAARQAERYRTGRVLLAGDAAHIHYPAGGQGLNLGVQDAMNLGWKLAADVRGHAPTELLDTYHTERHPVGARALDNTRAQTLPPNPSPETLALHRLLTELTELPDTNRYLAGMISGLDIRYPLEGPDHPLLGARLPDTQLTIDGHPRWASTLFHPGRPVLLSTHPIAAAQPWSDRVTATVVPEPPAPDTQAVLVRPDGYICWATTTSDTEGLETALRTWFGA